MNPCLPSGRLESSNPSAGNFMKRWLVVELLVPKEFGDAVSNFLIEQGATGIEELDEDLKWGRLRTYFPQDEKEKRVLRALYRYLKSLKSIDPEISQARIETSSIPEQDWSENWKRFFKPLRVTSKFVVKPPWSPNRLKKGQMVININPGMAFGTGTHATTKMSLRALESSLKRRGLSVLDVGTGSGILSIAAARLGASEVWGVDIDGVAVENARENVKQNHVSKIVRIRKGKIGDIQKRFDVVIANIDFKSLIRMRMPLFRHLKRQGILILSGILEREKEKLLQHYMETGLIQSDKVVQEEEWVCLILQKK
jgi:ribosomal protein L11 methyltransferase